MKHPLESPAGTVLGVGTMGTLLLYYLLQGPGLLITETTLEIFLPETQLLCDTVAHCWAWTPAWDAGCEWGHSVQSTSDKAHLFPITAGLSLPLPLAS